jgi:hypothetical protein
MVKKMIYLDPDRQRLLKRLAQEQKASETEIVRRALDRYAATMTDDPLRKLIGMLKGGPVDGSISHDEVIVEAIEAKIARGHRSAGDLPEQGN